MTRKLQIAIVGAGRLANVLAPRLHEAGYRISEIVSRDTRSSRRCSEVLARKVQARVVNVTAAALQADLLWLCVPDREIRRSAEEMAVAVKERLHYAFHSSGALVSDELAPLRKRGVKVASVHPLMTFVPHTCPPLQGVPFALQGDRAAVQLARRIVRVLGGESFLVQPSRKAAYHAWATFTSPLWLAFLVTLEEAALAAGLKPADARRRALPILRQTLENYVQLGPEHSFSGPIIRGDVATVSKHLAVLRRHRRVRAVYRALAQTALDKLPSENRQELQRLLEEDGRS